MSKIFMYGAELQDLEQMMMLVPNFIPRGSGLIVVKNLQHEGCNVNCFKETVNPVPYCLTQA